MGKKVTFTTWNRTKSASKIADGQVHIKEAFKAFDVLVARYGSTLCGPILLKDEPKYPT